MNLKDRMNYDKSSSMRSEPVSAETLMLRDLVNSIKAEQASKEKKRITKKDRVINELQEKIRRLSDMNAELRELVDMSNVETVKSAIAAKNEAEDNARKQIAECKRKAEFDIDVAKTAANIAKEKSLEAIASARKSVKTSRISLLCILICSIITAEAFWNDLWKCICWPVNYAIDAAECLFAVSKGSSLGFNIFLIILCHLPFVPIAYVLYKLVKLYIKKWSRLSYWIMFISFTIVVIFGNLLKKFISWNLIIVFFLIQIIYSIVLGYLGMCKSD